MPLTLPAIHDPVSRILKGKAMAAASAPANRNFWNGWRIARWSIVAGLWLLPLIAMQFTREVRWTASDFVFVAIMLGGTALLYEIAVLTRRSYAYRGGIALALAATFLLIWINGAVGIIGNEGNPANLIFAAPPVTAFIGALIARFGARGMARAMAAAGVVQIAIGLIAVSMEAIIPFVTVFFAALWLTGAVLFNRAIQTDKATG